MYYSLDNISWIDINNASFPIHINNTSLEEDVLTVYFTTDLFLSNTYGDINGYFIMDTSYITIEGNNNIVNITNITGYYGLINNITYENIIIQNLGVITDNLSNLQSRSGWIGQQSFIGTATNCYSTGDIRGMFAGGIFGSSSSGTATNCYSTGDIMYSSGGIFGSSSSGTATNCYSTGNIMYGSGGIFGPGPLGTATNCYIANGSWSDSDANASLDISGTVWTDISSNTNSLNIPKPLLFKNSSNSLNC